MAEKLTIKKILLGVTIMIGILTCIGMISLVAIAFIDCNIASTWKTEGIIGSAVLGGMGALTYFTKKFIDTRSDKEKDDSKLEFRKEKHRYKLEKLKIHKGIKNG